MLYRGNSPIYATKIINIATYIIIIVFNIEHNIYIKKNHKKKILKNKPSRDSNKITILHNDDNVVTKNININNSKQRNFWKSKIHIILMTKNLKNNNMNH